MLITQVYQRETAMILRDQAARCVRRFDISKVMNQAMLSNVISAMIPCEMTQ
jgi:hypothetical protein